MMFGEEERLPLDSMFGPTPSDQQMCPREYVHWQENALVEIYNQANKKTVGRITYMKRHYDKKTYGKPHEIGVRRIKSHTYIRKMFGTLQQNKKMSSFRIVSHQKPEICKNKQGRRRHR